MRRPASTPLLCAALLLAALAGAEDRVLATLIDPAAAQPGELGPAFNPWFWSKEQKAEAGRFSQAAWVEVDGVRCLRLALGKDMPWTRSSYHCAVFGGPDYLDPESDALRLRCKVLEGSFRLSFGGPTSYFANSDVMTRPVDLAPGGEWTEVVIPLHVELSRNFRRAGFGARNPLVSYARWIQERMQLQFHQGSHGVLLVQRLDLVGQGLGQPFPVPPAGGLPPVGPALVPAAADLFSAYIQRDLVVAETPKITNQAWRPMAAAIEPRDGRLVWSIQLRGAEEVSWAGCRLRVPAAARALALEVAVGPVQADPLSLDFLFLVAEGEVPWAGLAPPAAWKAVPEAAFDALFTKTTAEAAPLALYHVRRAVAGKASAQLLIPWEDAVCVWSAGTLADDLLRQRPLRPDGIRALLVTNSWRNNKGVNPVAIAGLQPVGLPADWTRLRSYHQPALESIETVHDAKDGLYGGRLVQTCRGAK